MSVGRLIKTMYSLSIQLSDTESILVTLLGTLSLGDINRDHYPLETPKGIAIASLRLLMNLCQAVDAFLRNQMVDLILPDQT
jgi:hypothetical protein